ncbi:hypothetical protein RRG08_025551 [Elysia crispata]|uniref:Ubiquitin-like domain-containing protein n=1 Tax=Elysia crispata TaxID=231223 RepID=A0AAE0ZIK0_9GAST|nr:hypothetical protein RRG08_025551 [Elysia crispata]
MIKTNFLDKAFFYFGAIDQLDQLWKQGVASACGRSESNLAPKTGVKEGSQSSELNMADQNGAKNVGALPQAVDLEATPDLELKIRIVYSDRRVKNLEGSLNPTRTVQQLKNRLAAQLTMQPHLIEMSWSKRLNNGQQQEAVLLDDNQNLMFYEVETDDTIIITELEKN